MDRILITFEDDGTVTWASDGWGHDKKRMAEAKKAINDGETPDDVIRLLEDANFLVIEGKEV